MFWWFWKVSYKDYVVYFSFFLLSAKDLDLKDLFRSLNLNRYVTFCHKRCLICSFLLEHSYWKLKGLFPWNYLYHFHQIVGFCLRLKFIFIKSFINAVRYYLSLQFLNLHFEFCYCQQMKNRKRNLKNIIILDVTGFVSCWFCYMLVWEATLNIAVIK